MDMRRLEVFCKVVELKSFTKAAEALRLSQPTASEHIRTLEEILGEKMIDRLGREVLPTPAGRVFYQYARNIVQMRDEAIEALDQFKGKLAGHLILGASTIPGAYFLPKFIASFKAAHASVQITLRISDTAEVSNDVLEGSASVGVVGSRPNDRRLVLEKLFSDELVLAVFPDHPWAKKRKIDVDQLEGEPFILREVGSGTRSVMTRILHDHGFDASRLEVVAEMGSTEAVRQGIKAGIGLSILSYRAVTEDFEHGLLAPVEINDMRLTRPLYLIQRKNRQPSPVVSAFIDFLRTKSPDKH
ncbi:MAG: selenium metabolism-associated LysR family transcriptional regulator [Deltaproteobacteria bacterium]